MNTVEVTRIPRAPELTKVPDFVVEYFAAQGKQVLLVHGGPNAMAWQSTFEVSPVYWDDIRDEEIKRMMRGRFEPPERTGGIVMRGTMALVEQPLEARDYFRGVSEQKKMSMMDASDNAAEIIEQHINQLAAEKGAKTRFVDIRQVPGPKVEEQGVGGQELLEAVLKQEASKQKK